MVKKKTGYRVIQTKTKTTGAGENRERRRPSQSGRERGIAK
jgi:hypothetical protein